MASSYFFWLQDSDSNILQLDSNVQEISLGQTKRAYSVDEYIGAPGGMIRGFGNPGPKKFIVSRIEKAESGDYNAWNSRRDDFQKFFSLVTYKQLYFYVRNGEDDTTYYTQVYPTSIGSDAYKYYRISDKRSFELISPKGLFVNAASTTGSQAVQGATTTTVSITNNGTWDCPIQLKYTPSSNASSFQVMFADGYGVRLYKSDYFLSGEQVVYDTSDNTMTINGNNVNPTQYITGGSVFNVPPGTFDLDVLCSHAGTFAYEFYDRKN